MRQRVRGASFAVLSALFLMAPVAPAFASGGTTSGSDLQITGSASTGSPAPGAAMTFTFQVKNSGPDTATGVVVNDPLPADTVFNYATLNGSTLPCATFGNLAGGATESCTVGNLAKGGSATVVVSLNAPLTAVAFSNVGSVTATSVDPNLTNNSATVNVTVKASGGGGGGGGVNKGGVNDTGTPTVAAPCASLVNLSAPVGYYSTFAAIWNTFTVKSCSSSTEVVNVQVTETNAATGSVDYDLTYPFSLTATQSASVVLDNDFAPFNTTYTVTMTATDASGNVLSTGSVSATTPPPQ